MKHKRYLASLVIILMLTGLTPSGSLGETNSNGTTSFDSIWERMIGSLQLQSLAHAIYCYWTGKSEADAARAICFERSDDPYSFVFPQDKEQSDEEPYPNLLFVPEPYDQWYYGNTDEKKITLEDLVKNYEVIPIARDALVFLANEKNPVGNLDVGQLQDIYMGRLSRWGDLGGADTQIKAFQSRPNSLSQEMIENTLMLHRSMSTPPMEWKHSAIGEIVDTNASYDNSEAALGYTMYFYTRSMFENDKTKLLSIEGIAPSYETIISGEYPLTTNYYAVFPNNTPSNDPIRALVKWLLTKEGQQVVKSVGLVPMENLKGDGSLTSPYPVEKTRQSSGTGGNQDRNAEPSAYPDRCIAKSGYSDVWGWSSWDSLTVDLPINPALQREIEAWCQNAHQELLQSVSADVGTSRGIEEHAFVNGNLVSFHFSIANGMDAAIRTAVFDMKTGRQLQLSDLFLDGFNYIEYINRFLLGETYQESKGELGDFGMEENNLKRPFSGLPNDYPYFVVSQDGTLLVSFEGMNPFVQVPYDSVFFAEVPLWHNISPWGGCKMEEMYTITSNDDKHAYCYELNLCIDEGLSQTAEHKVNGILESITDRFLLSHKFQDSANEKGQTWMCMPIHGTYGDYHSFVFIASDDTLFFNPQTIGGTIINLHTGEEMLTDEQAKGLAGIPGAAIFYKDDDNTDWNDAQSMDEYSASAEDTVCAMWLETAMLNNDSDHQEMHVVVEIQKADDSRVRISVPIKSIDWLGELRK